MHRDLEGECTPERGAAFTAALRQLAPLGSNWAGLLSMSAAAETRGMACFIHVTITDEYPYAQAQVIIEARPAERGA